MPASNKSKKGRIPQASKPTRREEILPLPSLFVDQTNLFKEEIKQKGLSWLGGAIELPDRFSQSNAVLFLVEQVFSSLNDLGLREHLMGRDQEGLTIHNDEWLRELNQGILASDNPFGDTFDTSNIDNLEASIKSANQLPPDTFWGEGAPEYDMQPCTPCKEVHKNLLTSTLKTAPPPATA